MQAPLHAEGARDLSFFDRPAFREAVRLLSVDLQVIDREAIEAPLPEFIGVYDDPPVDFPYPPIFFNGVSETADGGHLHLEGCVMMGIDGSVRWYFVSSGLSLLTSVHSLHIPSTTYITHRYPRTPG